MLLSREDHSDALPFWYAEVLGAFLITVDYAGDERKMEFLWVRWFGVMPGYHWGFRNARLPKIGFVPVESGAGFGFLDPSLVLRACHIIPAFADGRTDSLLRRGPSVAWQDGVLDDWAAYFVNIFADRDMFARYRGVGVGHHAQYATPASLNKNGPVSDIVDIHDEQDGDECHLGVGSNEREDPENADVPMEPSNNDNNDDKKGSEDGDDDDDDDNDDDDGNDDDDDEETAEEMTGSEDEDSDLEDGLIFKF